MNKSLKIFVACFLGAGIGTLTALQLNGYFWWLGLLAGGLVGYLAYEFKKVLEAIPKAWRAVITWRPNWKNAGMLLLVWILLTPWMILLFGLMGSLSEGLEGFKSMALVICLTTSLVTFFSTIFVFFFKKTATEEIKETLELLWEFNIVFVFLYYLPVWLIKSAISIAPRIPGFLLKMIVVFSTSIVLFVKALLAFVKTLFIMIHSEIRLLCGIDAAIGATIGYFAGNVIIGAIFGGAIGLLNYEILSKRILHLVPSKINNA